MATWEDGPEYAPRERPFAFAVPAVAPLPEPVLEPSLAVGAPPVAPSGYVADPRAASLPQKPLPELVPVATSVRDPRQAFEVVASTVTATDSAWGAAHQFHTGPLSVGAGFDPHAPLAVRSSAPAIQLPAVNPAPPATAAPGVRPGASAQGYLAAMTPGVLISLVVSMVVPAFAPVGYLLAFALATRIRVAGNWVRGVFALGTVVITLFALTGLTTDGAALDLWWGSVGSTASWVSLITLCLTSGIVVATGSSRGRSA